MTDDQEQQLIRETNRGAKAAQLLRSEIYVESMRKVEDGITQAWKDSPIRDAEGQQYLRLMMKVLKDLQAHIKDVAETGRMADVQLTQERSLADRARSAVKAFKRA